jgi:Domain of Unknown Function with PDB structure (DUF3857)
MIRRAYSAFMVLLVSSAFVAAQAGDANPGDPGWLRTVSHYDVTFDGQGRSTIVFDFEIQAVDDKGAAAIAQQTFAYNSDLSELSSSDLATVKADGRLIAVDGHTIRDQPASADSSSSHASEERRRIIAFSHVAAGDKIKGRLIYRSKTADFAGEFADDGGAFAGRSDRADAGMTLADGLKRLPE